jgi:hypothetical protein
VFVEPRSVFPVSFSAEDTLLDCPGGELGRFTVLFGAVDVVPVEQPTRDKIDANATVDRAIRFIEKPPEMQRDNRLVGNPRSSAVMVRSGILTLQRCFRVKAYDSIFRCSCAG